MSKAEEFKRIERAIEINGDCIMKASDKGTVAMYSYLRDKLLEKWEKLLSELTPEELAVAWGYKLN